MKYFNVVFGGAVDVEINREKSIMIGTKKCEILGKKYDLENNNIQLDLRIVGPPADDRITTYGDYRFTTYNDLCKIEVV